MAILPSGKESLEDAIKRNPSAGPKPIRKPISLEEYKQKRGIPEVKLDEQPQEPEKRKRGGKQVQIRQQLGELHRVLTITTDRSLRRKLIKKINNLKWERRQAKKKSSLHRMQQHPVRQQRPTI